MRVLFLFCERFGLETFRKGHSDAPDDERELNVENAVVCLIHAEPDDDGKTVTKLIKNAKWIARKFDSRRVVLHFFAHLGEVACEADTARELIESARDRLVASDYDVTLTPFGYFCRLDFGVHGESLAKIFKVL